MDGFATAARRSNALEPTWTTSMKRPATVWAITVLYTISFGWVIWHTALFFLLKPELSVAQHTFLAGLGPADYAADLAITVLTATAVLALFRMKRIAVPLLGVALVANVSAAVLYSLGTNWLPRRSAVTTDELLSTAFGLLVLSGVYMYSRRLRALGLLK